jgi:heme exporter protein A
VTGRNGSGKSSLLRLVAGLLRPETGQISVDGGDPELSLAEQAHYLGHQDALKPSLTVGENLRFWSAYLGPRGKPAGAGARTARPRRTGRPARGLSLRRTKAAAVARAADHGLPPALAPGRTGPAALDADGQARLADLMRVHLVRGGMILAAAHGPIGLDGARELKLGAAA